MNGRTIEMEGCRNVTSCIAEFRAMQAIATPPYMGILWLTHSDIVPVETQCDTAARVQEALPWVSIGTDFYDGSHVECGDPRPSPPLPRPQPTPSPGPRNLGAAYYMLQESDLSTSRWPIDFINYTVFVAPATLSTSAIKKVHEALPHSILLAYTAMNVIEGHQGGCANCSYIYAEAKPNGTAHRCVLEKCYSGQ